MSEVTPTGAGRKLIADWQAAKEQTAYLARQLADARNTETLARRALAKLLLPNDAVFGEKFCIWDRDRHGNDVLIEVTVDRDAANLGALPQITQLGFVCTRPNAWGKAATRASQVRSVRLRDLRHRRVSRG